MRLYLPRVEARLRGITTWWFCRKKGHLHTIPCNEQEWDKELAYNRQFTQWTYNSYINQSTHIVRLRTKPKEKKITPNARSPTVPNGLHYWSTRNENNTTNTIFIELLLKLGCITGTGIIGTCNCCDSIWWVTRTQQSQNPRDQDYLSLWVGIGNEVGLQQALSKYGG